MTLTTTSSQTTSKNSAMQRQPHTIQQPAGLSIVMTIGWSLVGMYGMSDILGPLAYDKQGGGQFLGNGNNPRRSVSDATAQAIDKEVRDLVDDAHETALNILRNNLPLLESISQKILQEEVIEGEDLKNLLAETKMPA